MHKALKSIFVYITNRFRCRDKRIWVFGEWFGERCADNSCYFANSLVKHHPEIKVYWITNSGTNVTLLNNGITVIDRDSDEAITVLKKCSVAVISQDITDFSSTGFNYTSGAIIVQLWHGIPWKKIGYDASTSTGVKIRLYRLWYSLVSSPNMFLSPSDKFDTIVASAFKGKKNQIIHAGYPRNSELYHPDKVAEGKIRILDELKKIAPDFDYSNVKIISYMPTFRNDPAHSYSFDSLRNHYELMSFLNDNNVIIIQKAHYVNQTRDGRTDVGGSCRIYSLNNITAQDLLCASDLLVTDYSGAFFDYLILDRPIVHYLYDYDYYRNQDRGLYYDKEDVIAGEEADNEDQLVNAIIRNIENPNLYKERRHKIRTIYTKYDTPDSCEVLYQAIMKEVKRRNFNESTNS